MNILFDINHPAHFHVLKHLIRRVSSDGHQVLVTSRDKDIAAQLLEHSGFDHQVLSTAGAGGLVGFAVELIQRDYRLWKLVRRFKPDVMVAVAGTFISHVGFVSGIPSLAIYDTEDAKLQNLITYPLLSRLLVPDCYAGWTPKKTTKRFRGYHELCYLRPEYFKAERSVALENGFEAREKTIFIRLVSWQANHDLGYEGWSERSLDRLIGSFDEATQVIISSERELPSRLERYRYRGDPSQVHHVLAACDVYLGESATMAAEAAVLGVPAIYVSDAFRSYMNDLQDRFALVRVIEQFDLDMILSALDEFVSYTAEKRQTLLNRLLDSTEDVTLRLEREIFDLVGS